MSKIDRIVHAVLYEVFALLGIALLVAPLMSVGMKKSFLLGAAFSLFAMVWNVVFNHAFDWYLENIRMDTHKSTSVRIVHTVLFEGIMVGLSLPVIAWALDMTLWRAATLEAGLIVFILFFTYFFNLIFDRVYAGVCRARSSGPPPTA